MRLPACKLCQSNRPLWSESRLNLHQVGFLCYALHLSKREQPQRMPFRGNRIRAQICNPGVEWLCRNLLWGMIGRQSRGFLLLARTVGITCLTERVWIRK